MMTSLQTKRENEDKPKKIIKKKRKMIEKVPKDGYKNKIIYINGNNKTNEWKLWMTKKIIFIVFWVVMSFIFLWTTKHKNTGSPQPTLQREASWRGEGEGRLDAADTSPGTRDHGVTQGQEENTATRWRTTVIPPPLQSISLHSSDLPLCTFPKPQD